VAPGGLGAAAGAATVHSGPRLVDTTGDDETGQVELGLHGDLPFTPGYGDSKM